MNDLTDFEVLEDVRSPFEDDPFEQDPLETEQAFAETQASPLGSTPAPAAAPEQPVQKPPAATAAPADPTAPPAPAEEPAKDDPQAVEARRRAEHEAAEAKRKAEWGAKQAEKKTARQAALEKIKAMNTEQLIQAAAEKARKDTEKLTRRNMKECVCEYIQTLCFEDTEFARLTLTPPKTNQIIPHIEANLDQTGDYNLADIIPRACPCCGQATRVHVNRRNKTCATMTLHCDNPQCETRRLRQFVHFAGKKAMDIEGLSEATLEKFIGRGWLHSYMDMYRLDEHAAEITQMDGFGEKSWQNLWAAIQRSRDTTFERYLVAMDIPLVGRTASRVLAKQFGSELAAFEEAALTGYDFTSLPDFGEVLDKSIHTWFEDEENFCTWEELQTMVHIQKPQPESGASAKTNSPFAGKNIVVTGKVEPYTRSEMNALIESLDAHAQSAVNGKTDYLVCGEAAGSKLTKARQLGVTVLTPNLFFSMMNDGQEGAA